MQACMHSASIGRLVGTAASARSGPRGMDDSGSDAKTRMTATAARLFQRYGYHAVGFRRIVEESGAPRGSIYHHFPGGKEQLAVDAIELSGRALLRTVETVSVEGDDVTAVLEGLAERLAGWLESSAFEAGCPVATVALECAPGIDAITATCRDVFRSWVEVLRGRLVAEGWGEDEARDFATTIVSAVEGALLLARVERDATPVRRVLRDLARRARRDG
jgi:TetR/AcrR family transcriptional repressor of lmrAB and yxaGH operons